MLRFERQVLKRRVKRDFIELQSHHQQTPASSPSPSQSTQAKQQVRFPPLGSGSQLRPANQVAAVVSKVAPSYGRPVAAQLSHRADHPIRAGQSSSTSRPSHGQFIRPANQQPAGRYSQHPHLQPLSQASGRVNGAANHLSADLLLASDSIATASQANAAHQQQQTTPSNQAQGSRNKTAPFNDPSWPLMWYLVSRFYVLPSIFPLAGKWSFHVKPTRGTIAR